MDDALEFTLGLTDQLSAPAGLAGTAADELAGILARLATATTGADGRLRDASGRFISAGDQAKAAAGGVGALGDAATKTTPALAGVAGGSDIAGKGIASLTGAVGKNLESLVPHNAALDAAVNALKAMGPEGEAAAVALQIVATVVAFAAVTLWEWVEAAVAAAEKRDALVATFDALGGAGAGEKTLAVTNKIAASLPFVTSEVNRWAKSLAGAGIQGAALESGIRAVASATAIMGSGGGAAADRLIKKFSELEESGGKVKINAGILRQMAAAGVSAQALAAQLGVNADKLATLNVGADKLGEAFKTALVTKGAPALEALGLTWSSIKAKFDEGLGSVFMGLSDVVKPFMSEIKALFGEFNKGSATTGLANSAMKWFLTGVFSLATIAVHAIHVLFLQFEIGAMRAYLFALPLINLLRAIYSNAMVLRGIVVILGLIATPFVIIAIVVTAAIAAIVAIGTVIATVGSLIVAAVSYVAGMFISGFMRIRGALSGLGAGAREAAGNFVSGLVGGILAGVGAVVSAVKGLASSALAAFSTGIDAHSPSRAMHLKGRDQFAAGGAEGIEEGSDDVAEAADAMGRKAVGAVTAKPKKGGSGEGRGGDVYNINVEYGGKREDFPDFETRVHELFEKIRNRARGPVLT